MSALVVSGKTVCFITADRGSGNSLSYVGDVRVWGMHINDEWWVKATMGQPKIEPLGPYPDRESVLAALRMLVK